MQKILVIIPMFGKEEYTRKCIDLTLKNAGIPVDILIVDDGSPVSFSYLDEMNVEQKVMVLRLKENSGFTNATNRGILWAQGMDYEYVHLLNNDTEPKKDFIKKLYDVLNDDKNVAIASSVRLYPKEDSYNVELYGADLLRGFQMVTALKDLKEELIQCDWIPVCSSLIRMSVIRELGLLNKKMRNHSSDLEYCLRVKIAGYKIVINTSSQVVHHHEVTTKTHNIDPSNDQKVLLEILSGYHYAQFMNAIPLDAENGTYGQIKFELVKK